jgi:hypothetical protein
MPSYWINLYRKISKRIEQQPVQKSELDINQNLNEAQLRKSKRRKTETQIIEENKLESINSTDGSLLWTEKYQFTDETDIVYNKSQLERLKQWLEQFKKVKIKPVKVKPTKPAANLNSSNEDDDTYTSNTETQSHDDDTDFNYDSDCSTSTTSSSCSATSKKYRFFNNAILLNGPYGSGKFTKRKKKFHFKNFILLTR